jgi:hypothetical protein
MFDIATIFTAGTFVLIVLLSGAYYAGLFRVRVRTHGARVLLLAHSFITGQRTKNSTIKRIKCTKRHMVCALLA